MSKKGRLSPLVGKHGKRKATIEKEKRQAIFDEIVSERFPQLIRESRPEYQLDRFMGKIPDEVKLTATVSTTSIPQAAIDIIEADLKQKKLKQNDV